MQTAFVSIIAAWALSGFFAIASLVQLGAPRGLRKIYSRGHYPRGFRQVTGGLLLLAATFLAFPLTRLWGVGLALLVTFLTTVTLLNHRQYAVAAPVIAVMIALIPAAFSGPT